MGLDFRKGLFFDRCHHHFIALAARCVENQKGKASVTGNETEFGRHSG